MIGNIPGQWASEIPSYFSQALHQDLSTLQFPKKSSLLQYVDDFLLCSITEEASIKDSIYLLQQLAEKGHKVSKEKLLIVLSSIHYLGHNLSAEGSQLFPKRIKFIQGFPRAHKQ